MSWSRVASLLPSEARASPRPWLAAKCIASEFANVFGVSDGITGSPAGVNLNSHGWSEETLVPKRNPWSTKQRMPTPKGVELPSQSKFNPFRVGSPIDHSHEFRSARHPWLFELIPSGDAGKLGVKMRDRIYEIHSPGVTILRRIDPQ